MLIEDIQERWSTRFYKKRSSDIVGGTVVGTEIFYEPLLRFGLGYIGVGGLPRC